MISQISSRTERSFAHWTYVISYPTELNIYKIAASDCKGIIYLEDMESSEVYHI